MSNVFTARDLCARINGQLIGDGDIPIDGLSTLSKASSTHAVWYGKRRYRQALQTTSAGLVICAPPLEDHVPAHCTRIVCTDDRTGWYDLLRLFYPRPAIARPATGLHEMAHCHSTSKIEPTACIGPFVSVGAGSRVGVDVVIQAGARIGENVRLGDGCVVMHNAVILDDTSIGKRCWIGPSAVIGSLGFGLDQQGRLPHMGAVFIGDDVTVGAQTCVDRGTIGHTRIGAGTHIDNLVQIGHNVQIGCGVVLCGQVGLAGSSVIGDGVVLGGQSGVAQHAEVGPGCRVAAQSGVTKNIEGSGTFSGHPAEPNRPRLRRLARIRKRFNGP
ncbi:MAG: UDP-3-O-(3-hydroxymyristoyl)glucosamine N-acyltransferase [Myxococcota bacterium]|nr:UDP-3-O-(3-hydroxymyristoyl)glucosamine N-acyltransferase [Myxococcota bacterium]